MSDKISGDRLARSESCPADNPLVSIIMSVYNCEDTITESIDSILKQTYSNWELIICDDASTDGTSALLNKVGTSVGPDRVRIITNEKNSRLAYSLNRCLEVASGEYIARMDGDDISTPNRLERQIEFLRVHPEVDLVGSSMRRFSEDGFGDIVYPAASRPDRWTLGKSSKVPFCHATIVARRSVFDRVGNYTVSWRTERGQDLDLWYKFYAAGLVGQNIDEPLYLVREDKAAVRRRTPRARLGAVVTRFKGNRSLRYPFKAYLPIAVELLKILVPYPFTDWYRKQSQKRG